MYELFAFLAPGLTTKEKKYTFGFLGASVPLFAGGCLTGLLLFPHMVELLASFASAEDSTLLQASYYVDFILKIVLATGIAFVLPVFLVMLNLLGVVSSGAIARSWRIVVVAIVLFSAVVTPAADVLSMFLIAVPMTALFLVALLIAWLHDRRARRSAAAMTAGATEG
ncbi:Tat protein translocase TatC [Microbacterium foliorum]|uniref:Tat protein translocase TatC n=1 Tax=Microbacterium foliorum TaxID=104336 RepID=A0ABU1HVA3_9MICO|nr:twin-arginine translocase subunit TatC [Microbacterium foliorum]MDR6143990.1 Tat protein translocase TatC [Microbacterium foliorum]